MNRRSLSCNWTEEDRRTRAKWMRAVAIFYGCIGLIVVGALALTKSSSIAPNELIFGKSDALQAMHHGQQIACTLKPPIHLARVRRSSSVQLQLRDLRFMWPPWT